MCLYGQTLKFLMGCQQVWINVELIYSIKQSLRMIENNRATPCTRFIRLGRIIVVICTTLFAALIACTCFVAQLVLDHD